MRGSLWHRWDPHIHAPGTLLADAFGDKDPWETYLNRIEWATPTVEALGVTDYFSLSSYEKVRALKEDGRLPGVSLIFPNVELRLNTSVAKGSGINIHLLVSPEDPNHVERAKRFLLDLTFHFKGETYRCCDDELRLLGRAFKRGEMTDEQALSEGANQFKVDKEAIRKALDDSEWAANNILVAVAGSSKDGTAGLQDDSSFAATRKDIERNANIIFSSQPKQRQFWLGRGAASIEQLDDIWGGRKPCLHGSDAHDLERVVVPDEGRLCWLKGSLTFDTLRHACLEPENRTYLGNTPPNGALPSQIIDTLHVAEASWLPQASIEFNPGLVAVIGARGSGKTALADLVAAGAYALSPHLNKRSFISRASERLQNEVATLTWAEGQTSYNNLRQIEMEDVLDYPRVQYLSQQFVDELCSAEGVTDLLKREIERVIFGSHPIENRDGATSFEDLLEIRAREARTERDNQRYALNLAASTILQERARKDSLPTLRKQHAELEAQIRRTRADRETLLPKGKDERVRRLNDITTALDEARGKLEIALARFRSQTELKQQVNNLRNVLLPEQHQKMIAKFQTAGLTPVQWEAFKLAFSGNVDQIIDSEIDKVSREYHRIKGSELAAPAANARPILTENTDLASESISRLAFDQAVIRGQIGIDEANAKKYKLSSEKIVKDEAQLLRLSQDIVAAQQADGKIDVAFLQRAQAYKGVIESLISEQSELTKLYGPLAEALIAEKGTLGKLSFFVRRVADVQTWASEGESLLDVRHGGEFRGKGSLYRAAKVDLQTVWEHGSAEEVSVAMSAFVQKHEQEFRKYALADTSNKEAYREWSAKISKWLYGTDHLSISYSIEYDGTAIEQLSPGTRGIVLLMLYLAIDKEDTRPLIIDQPEENLDPKSVFDELVDRFRTSRERRQIIIVTHNANLVINTDVDQVIVASCHSHIQGQLPVIGYISGGLEDVHIRKEVCDILEGGEAAFRERAKRLRVGL